jgi:hypothetical protein
MWTGFLAEAMKLSDEERAPTSFQRRVSEALRALAETAHHWPGSRGLYQALSAE